eukprot:PhF_6_TR13238/c0_g1_i2/m.20971
MTSEQPQAQPTTTASQPQVHTITNTWIKSLRSTNEDTIRSSLSEIQNYVSMGPSFFSAHAQSLVACVTSTLSRYDTFSNEETRTSLRECVRVVGVCFGPRASSQCLQSVVERSSSAGEVSLWDKAEWVRLIKDLYVCAMPWLGVSPIRMTVEAAVTNSLQHPHSIPRTALLEMVNLCGVIALFSRPVASDFTATMLRGLQHVLCTVGVGDSDLIVAIRVAMGSLSSTVHPRCIPLHTRMMAPSQSNNSGHLASSSNVSSFGGLFGHQQPSSQVVNEEFLS